MNEDQLYSRQTLTYGKDGQQSLKVSSVLIDGLDGVGAEIAKDLILSGVGSVFLRDSQTTTISDLSTHFYLRKEDIGKNRVKASIHRFEKLNPLVSIKEFECELTESSIKDINHIVLVNKPDNDIKSIEELCLKSGANITTINTTGPFFRLFNNFGDHKIQKILTSRLGRVSIDFINSGPETIIFPETAHSFQVGNIVHFKLVKGMTELNEITSAVVKEVDPSNFAIDLDSSSFKPFEGGGIVEQLDPGGHVNHIPFVDCLWNRVLRNRTYGEYIDQSGDTLETCFNSIQPFIEKYGQPPRPHNQQDADRFVELCNSFNGKHHGDFAGFEFAYVNPNLTKLFAKTYGLSFPSVASQAGSLVASEVIKGVSHQYTPITQLHYSFQKPLLLSRIRDSNTEDDPEYQPLGDQYDDQIQLIGRSLHEHLRNVRILVVGAGAIGCEDAKLLALMGAGTGPRGMIIFVDMDKVELSNLSRQFLFHQEHIGLWKAEVVTAAIKELNPSCNAISKTTMMAKETENEYDAQFWGDVDLVLLALDNNKARTYVTSMCWSLHKPMIDSGTEGLCCNSDVMLPGKIEQLEFDEEGSGDAAPLCTLHNFPYMPEHTMGYALDMFTKVFNDNLSMTQKMCEDWQKFESQTGFGSESSLDNLHLAEENLERYSASDFKTCVEWALFLFHVQFDSLIAQRVQENPIDSVDKHGKLFWSGNKRFPHPIKFDVNDETHLEFVASAACIRAQSLRGPTFSLSEMKDKVKEIARGRTENTRKPNPTDLNEITTECNKLVQKLKSHTTFDFVLVTLDKDMDSHLSFIISSSSIRSSNYDINQITKEEAVRLMGLITPALATTTAYVSSLVASTLIGVISSAPTEMMPSFSVNLGVNLISASDPILLEENEPTEETEALPIQPTQLSLKVTPGETIGSLENRINTELQVTVTDITTRSHGQLVPLISELFEEDNDEYRAKEILSALEEIGLDVTSPVSPRSLDVIMVDRSNTRKSIVVNLEFPN
ncbi:putative Ubiquitin-activating enzyme E1 2 [Blattamonas nauphoetae]|uniref:E1 ubiquitin-activating enzyme n=1 Tax=Blattamonas nauphoetae TaxID=2049346 RepID=A0ABQ9YL58_9EUKA|nr:putative Ubiquitin-activating enzyme E1 2 [Blattamonas nauphoetae]